MKDQAELLQDLVGQVRALKQFYDLKRYHKPDVKVLHKFALVLIFNWVASGVLIISELSLAYQPISVCNFCVPLCPSPPQIFRLLIA